uniref:DUF6221 family protein n=1 Tax=Streptomyces sp. NRRL F-5135 TaxID=1463858 RepID=UPI0004C9A014
PRLDEDERAARVAKPSPWHADGDPARVLRELEAKRALVDAYEQARRTRIKIADEHWGPSGPTGDLSAVERWREHDAVAEALKPHVQRLAAQYVGHPEYRQEWRP